MKGRKAAIVLGAFLGALGTQGLWASDDDRAVPRGDSGGSMPAAADRHPGGSDSSSYSAPSYSAPAETVYFASASAGDDNRAVPRSGGSSGGGGHHSSGGSSSGSSAGAHHSSGGSGGSSYSAPSERASSARAPRTEAQRRHPQPGTGTGYRRGHYGGGYYGGRYYGSYYSPYYYWPYDNFYWGYGYYSSPWYYPRYGYYGGYGPGYGYGYGYHRGYYDRSGSVRVMVEPNETKVYVDGYYAGTSDDFDGLFQRLNLTPGRHDIALKLEGYESHNVKLYVPLDHTIKIKHRMVRGSGDRTTESSVGDPADEARYARRADDRDDDDPADMDDDRYQPEDRAARQERRDDSWPAGRERGTLRLDVSPADASIYVDGMFRGTGDDLRRLSLPAGRHRLEVVRPGYRTWERDVEVQAGETEEVDVDLPRS
jgi:hypothetical protein